MRKGDPRELALIVALRANDFKTNPYQMGAVLVDNHGIYGWGWCHRGNEAYRRSVHAEIHALRRSNPARWWRSSIFVAGLRRNSKRLLLSRPCDDCRTALLKAELRSMWYHTPDGEWKEEILW